MTTINETFETSPISLEDLSNNRRFRYSDRIYIRKVQIGRWIDCEALDGTPARFAHSTLVHAAVATGAKPAPCGPLCLGFAVFNEDGLDPEIQRCDECNRFADDYAAMLYAVAMTRAAEKSGLRPRALSDGSTVIDPNGGPWLPTDPAGRPLPAQDHDPLVCSYCGAEGVTLCVRVNTTTGQVDTEDSGSFPFCDRCKRYEGIGPIPRSTYEDPGPDDCVEQLIRFARAYIDGATTRGEIAGYFEEYGPGLVRGYSKIAVLNLAVLRIAHDERAKQLCGALSGTVGEAFLSSVHPCF